MSYPMNKTSLHVTSKEAHSFWSKVDIVAANSCWEWMRYCLPFGHGQVSIGRKTMLAHRVAYCLTKGEIPPGFQVRHLCDNPRCCNPKHLALGKDQDNSDDKCKQGRQARGSGNGRSKLSEEQVLQIHNSNKTQEELASQFGIRQSMVSRIKAGVYWNWLTGAAR